VHLVIRFCALYNCIQRICKVRAEYVDEIKIHTTETVVRNIKQGNLNYHELQESFG
jgi:hypothetical protein